VEIKTKKSFNDLVKSVTEEIMDDEDLDEITATGNIDGYMTPFAFTSGKGKKKNKKISTNSTGYKVIDESLDAKDLEKIKSLIKLTIADVIRDIWLKRTTWNK